MRANAPQLPGGGGWAQLELTGALHTWPWVFLAPLKPYSFITMLLTFLRVSGSAELLELAILYIYTALP